MEKVKRKRTWEKAHREELCLRARQYRREHPEKAREQHRQYYLWHSEAVKEYMRRYRMAHPDKVKATCAKSNAKYFYNMRQKAISLLGGKCAMCGYDKDPRAFQIDHINGGGNAERRYFNSSTSCYKNIFATEGKGYQLLCANCNQIKEIERRELLRIIE